MPWSSTRCRNRHLGWFGRSVKDRTRFIVILGDDAGAREAVAREHLAGREFQEEVAAANWPFEREVVPRRTAAPVIWIRDLHLAFPAGQTEIGRASCRDREEHSV